MRLHQLEISAFGPYPGRESVDFDALGAEGLFLLFGDTGAGKTTVLDAVAFALFGTVPGARGEVRQLRCDYADPTTQTEVALELTIGDQRLRLVRGPEYERAKKRGDGVTKQPAKASLTWLNDVPADRQPLMRVDEVARAVSRLLGMTDKQFFQVALLPQGEFARFLRADTAEREQLLTQLFGVERFTEIERWFRERRLQRRRELQELQAGERELVARIAQAAGQEPPEGGDGGNTEWLASLRKQCGELAAGARDTEREAGHAREQAEAELAASKTLAERVRRARGATEELAQLAEHAAERQTLVAELAAAQRARPVLTAADALTAATDRADRAEQAESAAVAKAHAAGARQLAEDLPGLRAAAGEHRELAGALSALVAEARQQVVDTRKLDELVSQVREATMRCARLTEQLSTLPDELSTARARLSAAEQAAFRLDGSLARRTELTQLVEQAKRLPAAEQAVAEACREHSEAIDSHQAARDALQELRQRRLDGMAAELAGQLRVGEPCRVCGSAEHPSPAQAVAGAVREADERVAADTEQRAHQAREAATNAVHTARQRLDAITTRLDGRHAEQLAEDLRAVVAEHDREVVVAERLPEATEQVRTLEQRGDTLRTQRATAERMAASAEAERAVLAETVEDRATRLDGARGEHRDVAARREHLLATATALDAVAEARATADTARQRRDEHREDVRRAAVDAGFNDPESALAAAREPRFVADVEQRLAEQQHREIAARSVLAEPELAGVDPQQQVELAEEQRRLAQARLAAESAVAAASAAEQREQAVEALAVRLERSWHELEPIEADFAELDALTDVVNGMGQNGRRMSLRSYVLAARLEEVAVAATHRLQRMSGGRYSFVHSDAAGVRGTRGGLGLDVLDDYSGRVRPAKTLSGGESFLASLSLALGLADVVAAESGGAQLDTLFVDEGFGTLDADTLEEVMDTLDELRTGGRVVGLVSHVEELRQRIPVQLRVGKARTGSTLRLITG